jgi:hypothetical protein
MTIPAGLWPEISALLDEALNLEAGGRAAWLSRLDADRPELAAHVRSLLVAHGRRAAADPLRSPPTGLLSEALASGRPASARAAGDMIGPYRLLAPLGEGGMASVWLAEQTVNVRRRVALKIPHLGLEAAAAARERFERERDLLAGLEHERIATPASRPTASRTWPWSGSTVSPSPPTATRGDCRSTRGLPCSGRCWKRSGTRTQASSSIATSRPRTSSSRLRGKSSCSTSESPT